MTAGPRRITLHIGTHKTGTTYLQESMAAQADRLARQGVRLLDDGPNHSWLYLAFCDAPEREHEMMKRGLADAPRARAWSAYRRQALAEELAAKACDHLLISGEDLCRMPRSAVGRFLEMLRVHTNRIDVVCCVRAPIDYAISDAQESIKGGLTWDAVLRRPSLPVYRRALEPYADILGRSAVRAYPYRKGSPAQLLRRFADVSGIELDVVDMGLDSNISLSAEAAYILAALNGRTPMFLDDGLNPARARIPLGWLDTVGTHPFGLPPETRAAIRSASADECDWLAGFTGERWFDDERPEDYPWHALDGDVRRLLDGIAGALHQAAMTIERAFAESLTDRAEATLAAGEAQHAIAIAQSAVRMRPGHRRARTLIQSLAAH